MYLTGQTSFGRQRNFTLPLLQEDGERWYGMVDGPTLKYVTFTSITSARKTQK